MERDWGAAHAPVPGGLCPSLALTLASEAGWSISPESRCLFQHCLMQPSAHLSSAYVWVAGWGPVRRWGRRANCQELSRLCCPLAVRPRESWLAPLSPSLLTLKMKVIAPIGGAYVELLAKDFRHRWWVLGALCHCRHCSLPLSYDLPHIGCPRGKLWDAA